MSPADAPTTATADVPAGRADGERGLLERLRRGDEAAAHELVERYGPRAYRLAIAITRDAAAAEEVVQDALRRVVRDVDTVGGDALGSWLDRMVTNAACHTVRRADQHAADIVLDDVLPRFHEDGAPATTRVDDWSGRLDDPGTASRVRATLDAAIGELAPDYRAVVALRDVEGLTLDEAATALGISVATVKARLHRARLFLRKRLGAVMANP